MAYSYEVVLNLDAVNNTTIDNATGPTLYRLGAALRDEVRRLCRYALNAEAAQWQTTDLATSKFH